MKALILAAGLGTRLHPFTEHTPKPLFPVAKQPLLEIIIDQLINAGCRAIIINTHHLHADIDAFIANKDYGLPVLTRHEPIILGTGGAIKNIADFWSTEPLMVINGDVLCDIDLGKVFEMHRSQACAATLVLTDNPLFNSVAVSDDGMILDFADTNVKTRPNQQKRLTFTGIQVIEPVFLSFTPENARFSSIDVYRQMIANGQEIRSHIIATELWQDLGSPDRYQEAVFNNSAPQAFKLAYGGSDVGPIQSTDLAGDGSDRRWYRLTDGTHSLIMADHGIRPALTTCEVDAFVSIGIHLKNKGLPVPNIYYADTFSGLVFLQDLGNTHLQTLIHAESSLDNVADHYRSVIDLLIQLSIDGAQDFDTTWTYQTPAYDHNLILQNECRYFIDAFINGYLGHKTAFQEYAEEFSRLADQTLNASINGFMHRDFQSRNIMVHNDKYYAIDFQGARIGPLQYDLASLLIDPYVKLPPALQEELVDECFKRLSKKVSIDPAQFYRGYSCCKITRNLQILGAFGYLTREKGKTYFEKYIPSALQTLHNALSDKTSPDFPNLKKVVEEIMQRR